jgi:hypothetical protein
VTKIAVLTRLQQLTSRLAAAPEAPRDELARFERALAEHLAANPNLTISGNRLQHEGSADLGIPDQELADRFPSLDDLLTGPAAGGTPASPLVFRRETAFRANLLGNSVPTWGAGIAPTKSFGPFVDEHGLKFWFDVFEPVTLVSVLQAGSATPVLRIPLWGTVTGRQSYRLEAGAVWVASDLIARVSALHGSFTGFKVRGGSLELSRAAVVAAGQIVIDATTNAVLHLDLDQPDPPDAHKEAGADAAAASVQLPKSLDLAFSAAGSSVAADRASCQVFGSRVNLTYKKAAPVWLGLINHILIPFAARARTDPPNQVRVASKSALCAFDGRAQIDGALTGWLLPATQADPLALGDAAGVGALCITVQKGLTAVWKGLGGSPTTLTHPSIVVEPGLLTVIDLFASNTAGRQRWTLWRNQDSAHHSTISLTFGKAFPFLFVSSTTNSEAVAFFCAHKAAIDRPVDANGAPFRVESTIAFAAILQNGPDYQALLLDNDLLFDGNVNSPDALTRHSLVLRNALFSVSRPYALFLFGTLEDDGRITRGALALTYAVHLYLPTLPDPYVASYTPYLREQAALGAGRFQQALTGFLKWPDRRPLPDGADPDEADLAFLYFRFSPLDPATVVQPAATRTFQTGVATFNRDLPGRGAGERAMFPPVAAGVAAATVRTPAPPLSVEDRIARSRQTGEIQRAIADLGSNPLLGHIKDKSRQVEQTLTAAARQVDRVVDAAGPMTIAATAATPAGTTAATGRTLFGNDLFMLLDVSSHVDQMGVSFGTAFRVAHDDRATALMVVDAPLGAAAPSAASGLPLQVMNMDVVTTARNVRAVTLPQVSWEPVWNIPLAIEGPPDPQDLVTVAPGLVLYDNDGIPTRIFSESPYPVPVTPASVTRHFLGEFQDEKVPRALHALFTLPFAIVAQADFLRALDNPEDKNARLQLNMPHFDQLRGGLQIQALAPSSAQPAVKSPSFPGWTIQLDNVRWSLLGIPLPGSTLGNTVKRIFNKEFQANKPKVPVERLDISGYGASMFSHWKDDQAAIAEVSQALFDVIVGRTSHEVVQVRSILYPFGVHVVRTITLTRSANGYVFRSDSGWKAESDGFYDFSYAINLETDPAIPVPDPYEFHPQPVKGVSRVREIRDYPAGGTFTSSFRLNDPDLPPAVKGLTLAQWQQLFKNVSSLNDTLDVTMQAVVFDADVHLDHVVSGGTAAGGDFTVPSRKMLGYVQLAPSAILVPAHVFGDLLRFQNGSLGGPVDCILDIAASKQRMRVSRVDVNPALDAGSRNVFVTAARGSLILPSDGSWSVVRQKTDTGDVAPVEDGQSVPLIKPNASPVFLVSHPADVYQPASNTHFGVLQSTGTQKLLFDVPQFEPNVTKLTSAGTYFADAYKLLNAKGVFPNIANALGLTAAEREVEILGEGLMKMAERTLDLNSLLPPTYQYAFVDEPGVLRIYAEYKSTTGAGGKLALGIDSTAALANRWKAALSSIRVIVDLGPFDHLMWVDGNFNAASAVAPQYDKPHLQFGPVLQPVVDILQVLATLSGDDFDRGMDVAMSNSADSWEYKFNCSKEIPVIKFPSPEQLTINPNPPLKLEAGLKVGFYFNEVLAIPTDLKQLVPACGAYVDFYGRLEVQCFTLAAASVYGVGQVNLGIAADTKAGITLHMKFGFGAEVVVGLPVVANVSVLYMVEVEVNISGASLDVAGLLLFRGSAEICGGLVAVCIQIEAGGSVQRDANATTLTAQVTFSIDVCVLWVIDIDVTEHWQETRQIA